MNKIIKNDNKSAKVTFNKGKAQCILQLQSIDNK